MSESRIGNKKAIQNMSGPERERLVEVLARYLFDKEKQKKKFETLTKIS